MCVCENRSFMAGRNHAVTGEGLGAGVDSGQTLRGPEIGDLEHTAVGVHQHVVTLQDADREDTNREETIARTEISCWRNTKAPHPLLDDGSAPRLGTRLLHVSTITTHSTLLEPAPAQGFSLLKTTVTFWGTERRHFDSDLP